MSQLIDGSAKALRAAFTGEVIAPGDAAYDGARAIWNGAIDRRPAVVARCTTAQHVGEAIGFARRTSLEISVRGGGHNFAGLAVGDDGLMIDLSAMNAVSVDPEARRARCGGGATWADLDGTAQLHALGVPGGFISHTGIAGLTLGGGMGWLTRRHGLSCDNLVGAEVVTAAGRVLTASATENPDLFWALRGGGGNFGVVTEFEFELHPVGPMVELGLFFWPAEQGREALALMRTVCDSVPPAIASFIGGMSLPPAPWVPEALHGATGFALLLADFEGGTALADTAASVRAAQHPLVEMVTPIPYVELQRMFDAGVPWGVHAYEKAIYLDSLSDAAIEVITEHLPRKASPLSFMPTFMLEGAYTTPGQMDTAFGGERRRCVNVNLSAVAPVPELYEPERAWVRSFWDALRPHARNAGSYVNFMSEYEGDRVAAAYGPEKYARLATIKAEYDPENLFHRNMNIPPAS
ncbi:MAG TPA: FAD-binding oxidoreductase [Candidatus Dormibacteraeota bacterium]|nr:FAD-binding oxidoreductase [Candidatus Dormibacteraeota bacterium]